MTDQIRDAFDGAWTVADKAETLQRLDALTKAYTVAPIVFEPKTCAHCRHSRPTRPDVVSTMRLWCAAMMPDQSGENRGLAAPTFDRRVPDDYGCTLHEPVVP